MWYIDSRADRNGLFKSAIFCGFSAENRCALDILRDWKEEVKLFMYAIIDNGNKQYKVAEGDVVRVEKLAATEGETVSFKVLMVADENGTPKPPNQTKGLPVHPKDRNHRMPRY